MEDLTVVPQPLGEHSVYWAEKSHEKQSDCKDVGILVSVTHGITDPDNCCLNQSSNKEDTKITLKT